MDQVFTIVFFGVLLFIVAVWRKVANAYRRAKLIDDFTFPPRISQKVQEQYPHLTSAQVHQVMQGLREYFHVCNLAGRRMVAMPSQVVDVAWHEFILFTKQYDLFCKKALGRFLHHTPAEAMTSTTVAQKGIKVAWRLSCQRENITPKAPTRLPILFAIDNLLNIKDGFNYSLDCQRRQDGSYCAGSIGCGSCAGGCGGDSGCGGGCGGD